MKVGWSGRLVAGCAYDLLVLLHIAAMCAAVKCGVCM